jgi:hypothetical protein
LERCIEHEIGIKNRHVVLLENDKVFLLADRAEACGGGNEVIVEFMNRLLVFSPQLSEVGRNSR